MFSRRYFLLLQKFTVFRPPRSRRDNVFGAAAGAGQQQQQQQQQLDFKTQQLIKEKKRLRKFKERFGPQFGHHHHSDEDNQNTKRKGHHKQVATRRQNESLYIAALPKEEHTKSNMSSVDALSMMKKMKKGISNNNQSSVPSPLLRRIASSSSEKTKNFEKMLDAQVHKKDEQQQQLLLDQQQRGHSNSSSREQLMKRRLKKHQKMRAEVLKKPLHHHQNSEQESSHHQQQQQQQQQKGRFQRHQVQLKTQLSLYHPCLLQLGACPDPITCPFKQMPADRCLNMLKHGRCERFIDGTCPFNHDDGSGMTATTNASSSSPVSPELEEEEKQKNLMSTTQICSIRLVPLLNTIINFMKKKSRNDNGKNVLDDVEEIKRHFNVDELAEYIILSNETTNNYNSSEVIAFKLLTTDSEELLQSSGFTMLTDNNTTSNSSSSTEDLVVSRNVEQLSEKFEEISSKLLEEADEMMNRKKQKNFSSQSSDDVDDENANTQNNDNKPKTRQELRELLIDNIISTLCDHRSCARLFIRTPHQLQLLQDLQRDKKIMMRNQHETVTITEYTYAFEPVIWEHLISKTLMTRMEKEKEGGDSSTTAPPKTSHDDIFVQAFEKVLSKTTTATTIDSSSPQREKLVDYYVSLTSSFYMLCFRLLNTIVISRDNNNSEAAAVHLQFDMLVMLVDSVKNSGTKQPVVTPQWFLLHHHQQQQQQKSSSSSFILGLSSIFKRFCDKFFSPEHMNKIHSNSKDGTSASLSSPSPQEVNKLLKSASFWSNQLIRHFFLNGTDQKKREEISSMLPSLIAHWQICFANYVGERLSKLDLDFFKNYVDHDLLLQHSSASSSTHSQMFRTRRQAVSACLDTVIGYLTERQGSSSSSSSSSSSTNPRSANILFSSSLFQFMIHDMMFFALVPNANDKKSLSVVDHDDDENDHNNNQFLLLFTGKHFKRPLYNSLVFPTLREVIFGGRNGPDTQPPLLVDHSLSSSSIPSSPAADSTAAALLYLEGVSFQSKFQQKVIRVIFMCRGAAGEGGASASPSLSDFPSLNEPYFSKLSSGKKESASSSLSSTKQHQHRHQHHYHRPLLIPNKLIFRLIKPELAKEIATWIHLDHLLKLSKKVSSSSSISDLDDKSGESEQQYLAANIQRRIATARSVLAASAAALSSSSSTNSGAVDKKERVFEIDRDLWKAMTTMKSSSIIDLATSLLFINAGQRGVLLSSMILPRLYYQQQTQKKTTTTTNVLTHQDQEQEQKTTNILLEKAILIARLVLYSLPQTKELIDTKGNKDNHLLPLDHDQRQLEEKFDEAAEVGSTICFGVPTCFFFSNSIMNNTSTNNDDQNRNNNGLIDLDIVLGNLASFLREVSNIVVSTTTTSGDHNKHQLKKFVVDELMLGQQSELQTKNPRVGELIKKHFSEVYQSG